MLFYVNFINNLLIKLKGVINNDNFIKIFLYQNILIKLNIMRNGKI